jgi:hypothetical protein
MVIPLLLVKRVDLDVEPNRSLSSKTSRSSELPANSTEEQLPGERNPTIRNAQDSTLRLIFSSSRWEFFEGSVLSFRT